MQIAEFSLINYHFPIVSIDLSNHQSEDLDIGFYPKGEYDSKNSNFDLSFGVNLSSKSCMEKPFVKIQCNCTFKFKNVSSFEEIPNFFWANGIAILFPYIRAYISLITTQANVPGIILPTLNLSILENELKQNTTQK